MLQSQPKARLKPRRAGAKGERAPLVRQTAVSYDGSIIVACHEDGSLTRYDRVAGGGGSAGGQQQQQQQQPRRPGSGGGGSRAGLGGSSSGDEEALEGVGVKKEEEG